MNKIKSVSTYTRQDESSGYWNPPTPLGANIENIDITTAVQDPEVEWTADQIPSLSNLDVTVVSGDTGATAFTKFNRCKNLIQNICTGLKQLINEVKDGLKDKTWTFSGEWLDAVYPGAAAGYIILNFPAPPLSTNFSLNISNIELRLPSSGWTNIDLSAYKARITPQQNFEISILTANLPSAVQQEIGQFSSAIFNIRITGSITFS